MPRSMRRSSYHWYGLMALMAIVLLIIFGFVWEFHQPSSTQRASHKPHRRSTRKIKTKPPKIVPRAKPPRVKWPYAVSPPGQPHFEELESPVLVLAYNELPWHMRSPSGCSVACNVTYDRDVLKRADVVLFTAPMLDHETLDQYIKPEDQTWIALCMSAHSDRQCKRVHADLGGRVDMIASYKPGSDLPVYFNVPAPRLLWRPTPEVRSPELVALLSSTCDKEQEPERFDLLTSLLRHLDADGVASYGECFHNKDLPITEAVHNFDDPEYSEFNPRANTNVIWTLRKHKFFLAFENHDTPYYHTEKFWLGFQAGAIPVYWGSETIKSGLYGPGPNSFIFAKDFKSSKELAKYIRKVANDKEKFKEFFAWKREPITAPYQNHKDNDVSNLACNICKKAAG